MRELLVILVCILFASTDAQGTCGSPTMAPRDSMSTVVSDRGTFYFYPTPFSSMTCVGTVVAYEFCYQYAGGLSNDVVSIHVVENVGDGNYETTWMTTVMVDRNCMTDMDIGVERCCGRTDLASDETFSVGANHAYGFVTPTITQNLLLTLENSTDGYNLRSGALGLGIVLTISSLLGPPQTLRQRSVQFIIQQPPTDPSPTPGTSPTPGSNVTSPPNPTSVTPDPSPTPDTSPTSVPSPTPDTSPTSVPSPTPDTSPTSTTSPTSDTSSTADPLSTSSGSQGGGGTSSGAIVAAVAVPLLVIGGVAVAMVIAIVMWKHYNKNATMTIDNGYYALYEDANSPKTNRTWSEPHYSTQQSVEESYAYSIPDQGRQFLIGQAPQDYLQPLSSNAQKTSSTLSEPHYCTQYSEDFYMVPSNDEKTLYDQIKTMALTHIKRDTIKIIDHLGSGQFGTVNRGEWESPDGSVEVAVKMLKAGSAKDDRVKFLQEAALMGQFQHFNVVRLHGVVTIGEPKMIVLELLAKGDLHNYLKSLQPEEGEMVDSELPHRLLSFSRQVASGLAYLAGKAFVHRDLAARNILVAEDGETIKVADFGMSRDLMDENYYVAHGGKIPVKWTAPEAIHFKKYSTASDVWSFGVVMYEVWSLGCKPFQGYSNDQAINMVDSRLRLPPPPGCPRAIYDISIKCWHPDAPQRPDTAEISQWLSRPDPQLLRWSEEDRAVHPRASLLGAEPEAAVELYKELQESYIE